MPLFNGDNLSGTRITFIPAAIPASIPALESSNTIHDEV